MSTTQEAADQAAKRISRLWRSESWDELAGCFSESFVQVGPQLKELSRGRSAAVDSYRAFMHGAKLIEYEERNFRTEVWPRCATTIYEWHMRYSTEGETRFSKGTDQFIFLESNGSILAVWRYVDFWEDRAEK
jgi:hypothetical protein